MQFFFTLFLCGFLILRLKNLLAVRSLSFFLSSREREFRKFLQLEEIFANGEGDFDDAKKSVKAMEVAGLPEAAEARAKLTQMEMALKKVIHCLYITFKLYFNED